MCRNRGTVSPDTEAAGPDAGALCAVWGKVILFGSRARGDNGEKSDIDLAVSGGNIVEFRLDIDEEVRTLLMFDVVNLDGAVQEPLLESIDKEEIVLYEKT